MSSLAFESLDRHVIGGRADHLAYASDGTQVTYARLLELSAALGGGLRLLGVEPGSAIDVRLPSGLDLVVAVLAVARLQAHVQDGAEPRLEGGLVHLAADQYEWGTVLKAGAGDPAVAAPEDPEGYADRMRQRFPDVFDVLLGGGTIA